MFGASIILFCFTIISPFFTQINGQDCGGNLTQPFGSFKTPGFPVAQHPLDCTWLIKTEPSTSVKLQFVVFSTVANNLENFVAVHDGDSPYDSYLLLHSGPGLPASSPLKSTGNSMLVRFVTGRKATIDQGFEANYYTVNQTTRCPFTSSASDINGEFNSPNFPMNYDSNTQCEWHINVTAGFTVRLAFYNFTTEATYDAVELFDGRNASYPLIARLSGTVPNGSTYNSTSSSVFVKFYTDTSVNNKGFNATYVRVPAQEAETYYDQEEANASSRRDFE